LKKVRQQIDQQKLASETMETS